MKIDKNTTLKIAKLSRIKLDDSEIEEQNARATWVCSICGENTADVDYDYRRLGETWSSPRIFRMPNNGKDDNDIIRRS